MPSVDKCKLICEIPQIIVIRKIFGVAFLIKLDDAKNTFAQTKKWYSNQDGRKLEFE